MIVVNFHGISRFQINGQPSIKFLSEEMTIISTINTINKDIAGRYEIQVVQKYKRRL